MAVLVQNSPIIEKLESPASGEELLLKNLDIHSERSAINNISNNNV